MDTFSFPALQGESVASGRASATQRAATIVARARADAELAAAATAVRAREEGFAQGVADAGERVEAAVVALELACSGLAAAMDERVAAIEARAAELAVALAEKIVCTSLELKPDLVLSVVAGSLRGLTERDHVTIEVNPADLELVRSAREELVERLGGFARVEIVPERRVPRGGCVVQTAEGEQDGSPLAQIERSREIVKELIANGG